MTISLNVLLNDLNVMLTLFYFYLISGICMCVIFLLFVLCGGQYWNIVIKMFILLFSLCYYLFYLAVIYLMHLHFFDLY